MPEPPRMDPKNLLYLAPHMVLMYPKSQNHSFKRHRTRVRKRGGEGSSCRIHFHMSISVHLNMHTPTHPKKNCRHTYTHTHTLATDPTLARTGLPTIKAAGKTYLSPYGIEPGLRQLNRVESPWKHCSHTLPTSHLALAGDHRKLVCCPITRQTA